MAMLKRVFFFAAVNIAVMVTLSIFGSLLINFLGLEGELAGLAPLLVMSLVYGMGASIISLLISRFMAKKAFGVQVIDPKTNQPELRALVATVHEMARASRIQVMPEVGIYDSPEVNAFATGATKNKSLVAVSTGLLRQMDSQQVRAILGHEVGHIANGDMVTMTLIQGVMNAFVYFFARIVASIIGSQVDERQRFMVEFGVNILLQIIFGIMASVVVNYFSRMREFRADAAGAKLAGRDNMISALRGLVRTSNMVDDKGHEAIASMMITSKRKTNWAALFSTHPPLEERIRRLETGR